VPFQYDNSIAIPIMLYHTGKDGVETIQEELDNLTEDLAEFLNFESLAELYGGNRLNGLVQNGVVATIDYGYTVLNDRLMRCNRAIWMGQSMTRVVEAVNG